MHYFPAVYCLRCRQLTPVSSSMVGIFPIRFITYIYYGWTLFNCETLTAFELIKRCSTMPLYIGRYLKTQMVNKMTAVFPPTKNFPLRTAVHIFIVTNRISFRKIKIDEWASYSKLIRNVHHWQETVTVHTIYIFFWHLQAHLHLAIMVLFTTNCDEL